MTRQRTVSASEARSLLTAAMSEDDLLNATIELATTLDWLCDHSRPARSQQGWRTALQGHAGRPDLLLAHRRWGVVFAELKGAKGKLTPAQQLWQEVLRHDEAMPGEVRCYVWRPVDWASGHIENVLRGGL